MMTNTYLPHVGGVARSVASFAETYRRLGHRTLIVAPTFEGMPEEEVDVVRVPAIEHFNGTDFSWRLPIPGYLTSALDRFEPEIVHSHHPFLLGDTALRIAAARDLPIVFTWHTMYDKYIHYLAAENDVFQRFMREMAASYAGMCDLVIAPSESMEAIIRERGVKTAIRCIPTGIDVAHFGKGIGEGVRRQHEIPAEALVIGHVGRLAPEKNPPLMARACVEALNSHTDAWCLIVGDGPSREEIQEIFDTAGLTDRVRLTGTLEGDDLIDAYSAMDVFAFASLTETQGMVLAEAMAAGVPVVAISAPGAVEVVRHGINGLLVQEPDERALAAALQQFLDLSTTERQRMAEEARQTADTFSLERCAAKALDAYHSVLESPWAESTGREERQSQTLRQVETEWNLWATRVEAAIAALVRR